MPNSIRILQISDTHWAKNPISETIDSQSRFETLCNWIASFSDPIDFIIHTGDWVHRGQLTEDSGQSTHSAWNRISELGIPVFSAVGNHDNRSALAHCLFQNTPANATLHKLSAEPERIDYWFYLNRSSNRNESFLVLDARASQSIDPQGELSESQLTAIENLLDHDPTRTWTVFLHYPPIDLDCDWIDNSMLIKNGIQLHSILARYASRIRGVFFGHVHRPICSTRDSILYASSGSTTMHFPNLPSDKKAVMQNDPIAFANYIRINQLGALVKTQWTML